MKTIDACGVSCPEPLLMLRNALKTEKEVMLLVDNKYALNNCERYAQKEGFSVNTISDIDKYKMRITATE